MKHINDLIKWIDEDLEKEYLDSSEKLHSLIEAIADHYVDHFKTQADEVAIFLADKSRGKLFFVYPLYLIRSEEIPLESDKPIVSQIFKSGQPFLDNNFLEKERLFQYEFIKSDDNENKLIWKLMGAPIITHGEKLGVVQISRKRAQFMDVGEDFSDTDILYLDTSLKKLAPLIIKYLPG